MTHSSYNLNVVLDSWMVDMEQNPMQQVTTQPNATACGSNFPHPRDPAAHLSPIYVQGGAGCCGGAGVASPLPGNRWLAALGHAIHHGFWRDGQAAHLTKMKKSKSLGPFVTRRADANRRHGDDSKVASIRVPKVCANWIRLSTFRVDWRSATM